LLNRILFFLITINFTSFASATDVDSLVKKLNQKTGSAKLEILYQIIYEARNIDPIISLKYQEEAFRLAEEHKDSVLLSKLYSIMSFNYMNLGNLKNSLSYSKNALEIAIIIEDSTALGMAYNYLGLSYYYLTIYDKAIENLAKALEIRVALNDGYGIGNTSNNLGLIYMKIEQYQKAIDLYKHSLKYKTQINDKFGIVRSYSNISNAYLELDNFIEAEKYTKLSDSLSRELNYIGGLGLAYNDAGNVYFAKKDYAKALEKYKLAANYYDRIGNKNGFVEVYSQIASTYLMMNRIREAEDYIKSALEIAEEMGSLELQTASYNNYYRLMQKRKDLTGSLKYLQLYNTYSDSLLKLSRSKQFENLLISHETKKIEDELNQIKEEKKINEIELKKEETLNLYLQIIILLSVFITALIFYRFISEKKRKENLARLNEEIRKQKEQLIELNESKDKIFKLIAHDLRNPFNGLLGITELLRSEWNVMSEEEKIEMIDELKNISKSSFELLENLLQWSLSQTDELNFSPERLNISSVIDENIKFVSQLLRLKELSINKQIKTYPMVIADHALLNGILRNLLTNAIKFSSRKANIDIEVTEKVDKVLVSIRDYGIGMSPDLVEKLNNNDRINSIRGTANEKGSGLGLLICREFIKKNSGTLHIKSEVNKGADFTFSIPKVKDN